MHQPGVMHGPVQGGPLGASSFNSHPLAHMSRLLGELRRYIQPYAVAPSAVMSGPVATNPVMMGRPAVTSGARCPAAFNAGLANPGAFHPAALNAPANYAPLAYNRGAGVYNGVCSCSGPHGDVAVGHTEAQPYFDEVDAHRISAVPCLQGRGPLYNMDELSPYRFHAGQHHYDSNDNFVGLCQMGSFNTGPYNEAEAEALYQAVQSQTRQSVHAAPRAGGFGGDGAHLTDPACRNSTCYRSAFPCESFNTGPYYGSRDITNVIPPYSAANRYALNPIRPPNRPRYRDPRNLARPVVGGADYNAASCCACNCICHTDINITPW